MLSKLLRQMGCSPTFNQPSYKLQGLELWKWLALALVALVLVLFVAWFVFMFCKAQVGVAVVAQSGPWGWFTIVIN